MITGNSGELLLLKAADLPNPGGNPAGKYEAAEYPTMRHPRLPKAQKVPLYESENSVTKRVTTGFSANAHSLSNKPERTGDPLIILAEN